MSVLTSLKYLRGITVLRTGNMLCIVKNNLIFLNNKEWETF